MTTEHEVHPYCAAWPDLPKDALDALADNIAERGLDTPIRRYNKQVIDGKNRLSACLLRGVTPNFEDWYPSDPYDSDKTDREIYELTIAANMRRHMTAGQRATVAAKLANMRRGDNQHSVSGTLSHVKVVGTPTTSQGEAAKQFNVSRDSVNTAAKVLNEGSEHLVEAMTNGTITPSDAAKITNLPKAKQDAAVAKVESGESQTVAKAAGVDERKNQFDPNEFDSAMSDEVDDDKPTNVPKHLKEIADSCKEFAACVSEAGRLKGRIEKLTAGPGGGKLSKWWTDIDRCLSQTQTYLKCYRFWAACPECKITDKHTKAAKDCKLCGGHGWIAESNGLSDIHKDWLRERGVKC